MPRLTLTAIRADSPRSLGMGEALGPFPHLSRARDIQTVVALNLPAPLAHDLRSLGVLGPLRDRLAQVRLVRQLTRQEACESAKLLDCGDEAKRSRRFGCLPWSLARALIPKR
jgi:hypothetical protein